MAKKFYAVKQGRQTGIFTTWDACKVQVHGYTGAVYKSFSSQQEAEAYLNGNQNNQAGASAEFPATEAIAYVDGSYHSGTREFSCGVVIFYEQKEYHLAEKYSDQTLAEMRNVAGEIKGAEKAMAFCQAHGITSLTIFHDYEGVARWPTGEWQAKKEGTQAYRKFYQQMVSEGMMIYFQKVKGHSGDRYNDLADRLAKEALGINS